MSLALIVGSIVLVVLAITAAAGYLIDRSAPEDGEEIPPSLNRVESPRAMNRPG